MRSFLLTLFLITGLDLFAQKNSSHTQPKPKLVVGLVIDQMRWDYLYRFRELYGNDGFKRLQKEGYSYENAMVPYVPTYTAPGHTCIYTGSLPAIHGIVGNNWFDKRTKKIVYCTDDSTVLPVGANDAIGKMSPANMWTTTITDELRLSNNFQSKVFGIALKDRGAILPAGHSANAAFWYNELVGKWISSSHYMKALPAYVNKFNDKAIVDAYMKSAWNTLLPLEKYTQSTKDSVLYEAAIPGLKTISFPHNLSLIQKDKYEAFKYTPFAATYTFDFAKTIIDNEKLGTNNVPDFLAISISSTDYEGHIFGPNSLETEDTYLRLDKDIADFLHFLDDKLGKNNYLLFLSADHAVAQAPGFLAEHNIPSGLFSNLSLQTELNKMIETKYSLSNIVLSVINYQVYLDNERVGSPEKQTAIANDVIMLLKAKSFITDAVELKKLEAATIVQPQKDRIINGYNAQRSGDIQFMVKPGYFDRGATGVTHGAWYPYDSHIPLIFFGSDIRSGQTSREVYMTDIAPTLAAMLKIQMPNGCVGKVLKEVAEPDTR